MDVYYIDWLNIVKFFHFVTIQQGIEYKDKIMMCISFAGFVCDIWWCLFRC